MLTFWEKSFQIISAVKDSNFYYEESNDVRELIEYRSKYHKTFSVQHEPSAFHYDASNPLVNYDNELDNFSSPCDVSKKTIKPTKLMSTAEELKTIVNDAGLIQTVTFVTCTWD